MLNGIRIIKRLFGEIWTVPTRGITFITGSQNVANTAMKAFIFDCEGKPASVGLLWEKWKRALKLYLIAINTTEAGKKRAGLLHMEGFTLQYNWCAYNIWVGWRRVTRSRQARWVLFSKRKPYVRTTFISKCKFTSVDDELVDQITEKYEAVELLKKS